MIPGVVAAQVLAFQDDVEEPDFSDVVFLCSWNGADAATVAVDESLSAHAITFNGNAQLDTAIKLFGSASLQLDGTTDWISCANHADFLVADGPFCAEGAIYLANTSQNATICGVWKVDGTAEQSWRLFLSSANTLFVQYSVDGNNVVSPISGVASGMSATTQHRYCIERDDVGFLRLYVDGVTIAEVFIGNVSFYAAPTATFTIGANHDGTNSVNGHVDETRVMLAAPYRGDYTLAADEFDRPNFAPVITSNGGGATAPVSIAEGGTAVTTVTATDANPGDTVTFSIVGGADADLFDIDPDTGVLIFLDAPDFEDPSDAGSDNDYVVIVQASDGTDVDTQTITVTVTDVADETVYDLFEPQGRLTLTSGVPVMTSTVSAATTVYYTPAVGNQVTLFDGSQFIMSAFAEVSQATTDATKSPAAIGASKVADVFAWDDGGTKRATRGPDWASDTARGTGAGTSELELLNGIWVNKVAITNGPAAQRGTWVGTIRSNASSQIDWILGSNNTAAVLGVWNAYNWREVVTHVSDPTNSWTTISNGVRSWNDSTVNRVSFVSGLAEETFKAEGYGVSNRGVSATQSGVAIGFDSTSAISGIAGTESSNTNAQMSTAYFESTAIGWHFAQQLEVSRSNTSTAYGDAGVPLFIQSGISFSFMM